MWDKDSIQTLLQHSDKAVLKALLQLYQRQTDSEQQMKATTDANGVGFNYRDSEILTDIAQRVFQWGRLTPKQTVLVRARLMKYWRQLAEIANANGAPVPQSVINAMAAKKAPVVLDDPAEQAAREAEADAHDRWLANQAAIGGMVTAGDCV